MIKLKYYLNSQMLITKYFFIAMVVIGIDSIAINLILFLIQILGK